MHAKNSAMSGSPAPQEEVEEVSSFTEHAALRNDVKSSLTSALIGIPAPVPWYIRRQRLLDRLDAAAGVPLILVSAAPGTGKTAAVADWVRTRDRAALTGWVTLFDGESVIWPSVAECLSDLGVDTTDRITGLDHSLAPAALTGLSTAIANAPAPLTMVLDGFEWAPPQTSDQLDLLIRCAAGKLQVVLVTRVDPTLPLYRYRLADTILELRGGDLAFDDAEATALLEQSGLHLNADSVHDLNTRTRGWAAGLRFAGRALAGRGDADLKVADAVATVTDINEYLIGEVLDAQSTEVRDFLLQTSVPDTMHPDLLAEVVGPGAVMTLHRVAKLNTFLEPAAGAPGSYRYYPFFRDLLRAQLAYESPEVMTDLQRRTGNWFAERGLLETGVRHLARGQLWEDVASVVIEELAVDRMLMSGGRDPLVHILSRMPSRPTGSAHAVVAAALALANGSAAECAHDLAQVPRLAPPDGSEDARLRSCQAVVDAVRARAADPPDVAVELATRARGLLEALGTVTPAEHPELLAITRNCLAIGQIRSGRMHEAARTLISSAGAAPQGSAAAAEALGYLALVDAMDGRLSRAAQNATRSLAAADSGAIAGFKTPAIAEVALAFVALERYDVDTASQHLTSARATRGPAQDPVVTTFAAIAGAGIDRASGRYRRAATLLDAAASALPATDRWLDERLRLEAARLQVARGDAQNALQELGGLGGDDPDAKLIAARAHLDRGEDAAALSLLSHADGQEAPLQARVTALLLEVAPQARHAPAARVHGSLERAVRLAAPERLRRPFREAPAELQQVLFGDGELASMSRWLDIRPRPAEPVTLPAPRRPATATGKVSTAPTDGTPDNPVVIESLTVKEREVLAHLAEMLSTQEIAAAMFVSVNTVRTHVRNILRKLGVTRRNVAVRRARELGLL